MNYFVEYICKYKSEINYYTVYSETAYKYLLKVFYKRINKKQYESRILQYNIRHTNILAINDVIIVVKKCRKKSLLVNLIRIVPF